MLRYYYNRKKKQKKTETVYSVFEHKNTMRLFGKTFMIKVADSEDIEAREMYTKHSTFHEGDSGLDLFILEDTEILPGETKMIDMGVQCQLRSFNWCVWQWFEGKYWKYHSYFLLPRSSISKTPLIMRNSIGLIDSAYTGNIKAPLYNTSSEPFYLKRGQRYVQLVNSDLGSVYMSCVDAHRETARGSGGFGSTGR